MLGKRKLKKPLKSTLQIASVTPSQKIGNNLNRKSRKLLALSPILKIINLFEKFNRLSNVKLAIIILSSMAVMFVLIRAIFTPPLTITNQTVMELIYRWQVKSNIASALTILFLYDLFLGKCWSIYQRKPQGKTVQ